MTKKWITAAAIAALLLTSLSPALSEPADGASPDRLETLLGAIGDGPASEDAWALLASGEITRLTPVTILLIILAMSVASNLVMAAVLMSDTSGSGDPPTGDPEEIVRYAQSMEAGRLSSSWESIKGMSVGLLPSDASMIRFTSTYWERAVEYAVYQTWSKDKYYSAEEALAYSSVRVNIEKYLYNWQAALDATLDKTFKEQERWPGSDYSSMRLSVAWDGGSMYTGAPAAGRYTHTDMCSVASPDRAGSSVYLYVPTAEEDPHRSPLSTTMYLFGGAATMTNAVTAEKITLHPGANDVSSCPAGTYTLDTPGVAYAGPILKSVTGDDAELSGGAVVTDGSNYRYIIPAGDGVKVCESPSSSVRSSKLELSVAYTDTKGHAASAATDVTGLVTGYAALVGSAGDIVRRAADVGSVTWDIFDACEESSSYIHPSTITTVFSNAGMTAAEIKVQYVTAMGQIADYWKQNQAALESMEVRADRSVSDVIAYGDIYYQGNLWQSGVVFTPYCYKEDQTLSVGTVEWSQQGYATLWAYANSWDEWTGTPAAMSSFAVLPLGAGYTFAIKNLAYKGEQVDSVTLTVPKIVIVTPDPDPIPSPDPPRILSVSVLFMVIFLELAVILALLGMQFGSPWLFFAAAAVAAVALLWPQALASICMGTFDWGDLIPGGWLL